MPLEDIRSERIKKLETLKEKGLEPYPAESGRTHLIGDILKKFKTLLNSSKKVIITGRVMAKREHGGSTFLDIRDASGKIQAYFKKDLLVDGAYDTFLVTVDIGDFLEVGGKCFRTKKGEETIEVLHWRMLAKSLRPLPEKWHGLQEVEERFRKRYLDLLMNKEVATRFELRSSIIEGLRTFHEKNGFLEVATPLLHPIPGGALAKPFVTHHNALDIDLYLRIAPELYLKRLLVGGWERVFEIGTSFRNEGIDAEHNPEFTMLESYAAYWNEEDMMNFVEKMFLELLKLQAVKNYSKTYENSTSPGLNSLKFKRPFARVTFKELLRRYAFITDYDRETRDGMATQARRLGIEVAAHESKGKIADKIYKKICRPYILQPTFVLNHPLEISPLAKKSKKNLEEVRRFQLIIAGMELANGFAELNDPLEQRERFAMQEKERTEGEEEAHRIDEDYIEALEYGMPPAAGLGIGIDRLIMLFTGNKNIREVVLFPTMRPKGKI